MLFIFFVSCEEKNCYRDFSIGQLGFGRRSILRAQPVSARASSKSFFGVFSIFESGRVLNKTLNDWPLGKQWVASPRPQCSSRLRLGEYWGPRGNKTHCFPRGQSLSAYWRPPFLGKPGEVRDHDQVTTLTGQTNEDLYIPRTAFVSSNLSSRTIASPLGSVMTNDNKIGRTRSGSPICFSRGWLQTELDDTKSYSLFSHDALLHDGNTF